MNFPSAQRLSALMHRYTDTGEVAGAVALIEHNGQTIFSDRSGYADIQRKTPVEANSIFRIASMTKPITSAMALMLVDQGTLRLEDPIAKWIPELANPKVLMHANANIDETVDAIRPIILHDLLMHRSGLAYPFSANPSLTDALRRATGSLDIVPDCDPDEWLRRVATLPLMFQPGSRWHYGYSTDVLGILLARATHQSLGELLRERIFSPLQMSDTGFYVGADRLNRLTTAYVRLPQSDVLMPMDSQDGRWSRPAVFESGGAGLVSTAKDYMAFARLLLNKGEAHGKQLLSANAVAMMTTDALRPDEHQHPFLNLEDYWSYQGFGLGLSMVTDSTRSRAAASQGQYTWPGAFGTFWFAAPDKNLIAILLFQEYWSQSAIQRDFQNMAHEIVASF